MNKQFRFSIAFQSDKTPPEYVALAKLVDRYPFDVVSVYNDLLFQPALGALLLMAPYLQSAQIGPAAFNPFTIHPLEIAGQIAVLDMVTEGRAYLGLVRGSWLDKLGFDLSQQRPLQSLREAALLVKHVLARHDYAFEGQVFKLAAAATLNYQPVRPTIPLMIGTWGKQTAQLAGEIADEIKVGGSANPAMLSYLQPSIDRGLAKAQRQAGSVGVCLGAVTVIDEDRREARRLARHEVALYLPVVAALDPTLADPEWLERIQSAAAKNDYNYISQQISDELLERFAFAGNSVDIIRQVESLVAAGASRVEFGTPHGLKAATGIKLLGEQVIPYFK